MTLPRLVLRQQRRELELVIPRVVTSDAQQLGETAFSANAGYVGYHVHGQGDRLANALVWQADVRHQDAVR